MCDVTTLEDFNLENDTFSTVLNHLRTRNILVQNGHLSFYQNIPFSFRGKDMLNEISKFPSCVREFMAEISSYIKSDLTFDRYLKTSDPVSVKDGIARINIKTEVCESNANYQKFIKDFEAAKKKYHAISSYTETVVHADLMTIEEIPEEYRRLPDGSARPNYRMNGVHIEISLKDLVLDKLGYFFNPDSEMGIADSIDLLRNCGMSDAVIMHTLNIPRTSYGRYCKITDSKVDMETPKTESPKTKMDTEETNSDTAKNKRKTEPMVLPS